MIFRGGSPGLMGDVLFEYGTTFTFSCLELSTRLTGNYMIFIGIERSAGPTLNLLPTWYCCAWQREPEREGGRGGDLV